MKEIKLKKRKKDYFGALKRIGKFTHKDRMEDRMMGQLEK